MSRIRSVKPEFFSSEAVARLSFLERLTWVGLWTHVDDEGRCLDNPRLIKAALFPLDDEITPAEVDKLLAQLAAKGRIQRYAGGGKRCLAVVNFTEHQKIDRKRPSVLPAPPDLPERGLDEPSSSERRNSSEGSSPDHWIIGSLDQDPSPDSFSPIQARTEADAGRAGHRSRWYHPATVLVAEVDATRFPHLTPSEKRGLTEVAMECLSAEWPEDVILTAARNAVAFTMPAMSFAARKHAPPDRLDGIRAFLAALPDGHEPERMEIA